MFALFCFVLWPASPSSLVPPFQMLRDFRDLLDRRGGEEGIMTDVANYGKALAEVTKTRAHGVFCGSIVLVGACEKAA